MFINEFHIKFISQQEKSCLFDFLRRVSRMETNVLQEVTSAGWHEWPVIVPDGGGLESA
jgi:hypothetical protein